MIKETIPLSPFKNVLIRSYGDFIIQLGDKEELIFEGDRLIYEQLSIQVYEGQLIIQLRGNLIDVLNLFIHHGWHPLMLKCFITVRELLSLELWGAGRIQVGPLNTNQFKVRLKGAGEITIEDLQTQALYAHLPGAGKISISGHTVSQNVTISGTGSYDAPLLKSSNADVRLSGIGSATLWVTDSLTASVHGMGSISYYGYPNLTEDCHSLGKIVALGDPIEQEIFSSSANGVSSAPSTDSTIHSFEKEAGGSTVFTHPKRQPDLLSDSIWGLIFIWAGIVLLANNTGWLQKWHEDLTFLAGISLTQFSFGAWALVALGAAFLLLLEIILRLLIPSLRKAWIGKLILALILLILGLDGIISWLVILPAFLVLLGFIMIVRGLTR